MKRACAAILVTVLGLTGSTAATAAPTKRTESASYIGSAVPTAQGGFNCAAEINGSAGNVGCVTFIRHIQDRRVEVTIEDAAGLDVAATVAQVQWNYEGGPNTHWQFNRICSGTDQPIRLNRETNRVFVILYQGQCFSNETALATSGEVTATFHSR